MRAHAHVRRFRTLRVLRFLKHGMLDEILHASVIFIPGVLGVCLCVMLMILIYAIIGTQVCH
jgi:hypothetical protein